MNRTVKNYRYQLWTLNRSTHGPQVFREPQKQEKLTKSYYGNHINIGISKFNYF
jgi:hypothetical protein